MDSANCYDGIDKYAVWLIKYKARQLIREYGFSISDLEDLEQELMLDLIRRLPKYNPKKAQLSTFIARVVEHKIASIIKAREAQCRDWRLQVSLNDHHENKDGGIIERLDTIDQDDYMRRTGRLSRPAAELRDLALEINKVVAQLSPELADLCELLKTYSITDISRDTGIPRGTIYEWRTKVRRIFAKAGLKEYL